MVEDMDLMDELEGLGVDVKEGLERVVGDESLYRMMLGMFVDMVGANPIQERDFDGEDCKELSGRVHALKGVAGNLSIHPLFTKYSEILALLREGKQGEAKVAFAQVGPIKDSIVDCIRRNGNA